MTFPDTLLDLVVEVDINGTWTDVTDELITDQPTISHGRSNGGTTADPASVTLVFDNRLGKYTPGDPRSIFWPYFGRSTQLRIKIEGGIVFWGEIWSIELGWPDDIPDITPLANAYLLASADPDELGDAVVTVAAAGPLRRIGKGRSLRSPLQRLVTSPTNVDHVQAYWAAEDGQDASFVNTSLPATRHDDFPALDTIGFTLASDDALAGSDPLPNVGAGGDASWSGHVTGNPGTWTLDLFLHMPEPLDATGQSITIDVDTAGGSHVKWTITIGWDGTHPFVRLRSYDALGAIIVDTLTTDPAQLFGPFVEMRLDVTDTFTGISWAITWAHVTTGVDIIEGGGSTSAGTVGHPTFIACNVTNAPSAGFSFGHVILHDGIPGGWLLPADVGWQSERALHRMIRLCAEEGVSFTYVPSAEALAAPDVLAAAIAETSPMGIQRSDTLLNLLLECEAADYGLLGEHRTLFGLRYLTRKARYNRTPRLVLDAALAQIAQPLAPILDDQNIRNDVTVQRIGGGKRQLVDPISSQPPPVGVGRYEETIDLSLGGDGQVLSQAGWRLHVDTYAGLRYPEVTIDLAVAQGTEVVLWGGIPVLWGGVPVTVAGSGTLIADWLGMTMGERIQAVNLPPQHPLEQILDVIAEGWTEQPSPDGWAITLIGTPAAPWGVAIWGEGGGAGRWSPRDSLLVADIDATQTSFAVTTPGLPWTTDPAQFPFDVRRGAEVMTWTAITGAGPTQTVTAIRNVNGFGRPHPAGAELVLATPAILAL